MRHGGLGHPSARSGTSDAKSNATNHFPRYDTQPAVEYAPWHASKYVTYGPPSHDEWDEHTWFSTRLFLIHLNWVRGPFSFAYGNYSTYKYHVYVSKRAARVACVCTTCFRLVIRLVFE